jgi:hypothetical protein
MNEHDYFREKLNDSVFKLQTKIKHKTSKQWINEYISEYDLMNLKLAKLIMENIKRISIDFYIEIVEEYGVMHFYIIDQEFKSICNFFVAGNGSNEITKSLIKRYVLILEIKSLHSYSKNKGKVIVNRLKELSKNANIPICLFDTNNKSDNYYINLGFINKGQIGVNGERLVVYEPR